MRRPRRNHTAAFKAKVALASLKGHETLSRPSGTLRRSSEPNHTVGDAVAGERRRRLRIGDRQERAAAPDLKALHAKIGQQVLGIDFLSGALSKAGLLSVKR